MYMYSWLITFEIFRNFVFLDRGVGGWGVSYPNMFWMFIYFFIFTRPLFAKKKQKSEITKKVGGWVQVSLGFFLKSFQNSPKPVLIV